MIVSCDHLKASINFILPVLYKARFPRLKTYLKNKTPTLKFQSFIVYLYMHVYL